MVIETKHTKTVKLLAQGHVTTLSYDLDTDSGSNINQEIKEYLMGMEWRFVIPEIRAKDIMRGCQQKNNVDTPATTAWKEGVSPEDACADFCTALNKYDSKHSGDDPKKFARGKAFAVRDNEYEAVEII